MARVHVRHLQYPDRLPSGARELSAGRHGGQPHGLARVTAGLRHGHPIPGEQLPGLFQLDLHTAVRVVETPIDRGVHVADVTSITTIIGSLGAGSIAFVGGTAWLVRKVRGFNNKFDEFMKDWNGTKARPGVPHKPGVMERLSLQDEALSKID